MPRFYVVFRTQGDTFGSERFDYFPKRTRHMSTSIRWPKPRYCVPLFVPLLKWFLGHKRTTRNTEGDKKQAVFIDVFYFVQENRKVKMGPEANALIH